jgi:hypothetical protein
MTAIVRAPATLSWRALNRALLERQMLRRRLKMSVSDALERLVGMQAQVPQSPYVGLWSRLVGFRPDALADLLVGREAVRLALMRSTLHLVTARDCAALRPVVQPMLERIHTRSAFGRKLVGLDRDALLAEARALLTERPRTNVELGRLLHTRWPDRDPQSLGYAIRDLLPLVQIPPRGLWDASGAATLAIAESWIGRPLGPARRPDKMLRRYLRAFGPASERDMQAWSGLSGLRDAIERLRPHMRVFRDPRGRELFDVPTAPRPRANAAAPIRFLPEFDNVLVAYADRSRIIPDEHRDRVASQLGRPTVLIDGFVRAMWAVERIRDRATLEIELFDRAAGPARAALEGEGRRLLAFVAPGATSTCVKLA